MKPSKEKSKSDYHFDYFKVLNYAKDWMVCNNFSNKIHAEFVLSAAFPKVRNKIILDVIEEIFNR